VQTQNLQEQLNSICESVDPIIGRILVDNVEIRNKDLVLYQSQSGGKRLRPALLVLCGQLFGAKMEDLLVPAASIEVLHNATLILDDIIDRSESRRDKSTTWKKYGTSFAQCASFTYLASVFGELAGTKNGPKLVKLYSNVLKTVVDGEVKDILFERAGREDEPYAVLNRYQNITRDDYFEMVGQKTASLLQACCQAGAICAGATDEQVRQIGEFGFNLGMAFQIRDDILDIFGDEKDFGKKIGKDIIEKKLGNYVILLAVEKLGAEGERAISDLLESSSGVLDSDVTAVTALISKTDALHQAELEVDKSVTKALQILNLLPQNENSEYLRKLAEYISTRHK
jgi:geranylgeranyl diphosphate synthase type I